MRQATSLLGCLAILAGCGEDSGFAYEVSECMDGAVVVSFQVLGPSPRPFRIVDPDPTDPEDVDIIGGADETVSGWTPYLDSEGRGAFTLACHAPGEKMLRLCTGEDSDEDVCRSITVNCDCGGSPPDDTPATRFDGEVLPDDRMDPFDSGGGAAGQGGDEIDQTGNGSEREAQAQADADTDFNNSTYECGEETATRIVACASEGVEDMPEGELFTFVMDLAAAVPLAPTDRSYVYALVVDSDGDPGNDWVADAAFPLDTYQGTDRWYELAYEHTGSGIWTLNVTQLDGSANRTPVASTARAVIRGNRVTFFVAASELPVSVPTYRLTSFGHDGAFTPATRGVDVIASDPTLSLLPAGCGWAGVECSVGDTGRAGALECPSDHTCVTERVDGDSRGVCVPTSLGSCGGIGSSCGENETCLREGDEISAGGYCFGPSAFDCVCATGAGQHVFPGCG